MPVYLVRRIPHPARIDRLHPSAEFAGIERHLDRQQYQHGGSEHRETSLGTIVVDGKGMTVYVYDKDTADSGKSSCTGQCAAAWPAVTTTSSTPKIDGVTGKIATITGTDGGKQVTLNGLPLYRWQGDKKAGDVTGQGYSSIWWMLDPSGAKITSSPSSNNKGY